MLQFIKLLGIEKIVKYIVIALLIGGMFYIIYKVVKNYKFRNVGFADSGQIDKGQLNSNVNYDNIAARVYNEISKPLYTSDCTVADICGILNRLNLSELLTVNNIFNSFYKGKGKGYFRTTDSFYQEIDQKICIGCTGVNSCDDQDAVIEKLKSAQIS